MTDIAVCRSCGNSGRNMFGNACVCGRTPKPDPNDLESALRDAKAKVLKYAQRLILLEQECKQMRQALASVEWLTNYSDGSKDHCRANRALINEALADSQADSGEDE